MSDPTAAPLVHLSPATLDLVLAEREAWDHFMANPRSTTADRAHARAWRRLALRLARLEKLARLSVREARQTGRAA